MCLEERKFFMQILFLIKQKRKKIENTRSESKIPISLPGDTYVPPTKSNFEL